MEAQKSTIAPPEKIFPPGHEGKRRRLFFYSLILIGVLGCSKIAAWIWGGHQMMTKLSVPEAQKILTESDDPNLREVAVAKCWLTLKRHLKFLQNEAQKNTRSGRNASRYLAKLKKELK